MRIDSVVRSLACLTLGACLSVSAMARTLTESQTGAPEVNPVPSRIVERINESQLVRLAGNTHPMARPQYDKGLLEPTRQLERMMLVLQRSPEQEAALTAFNARQYDPKSPDYHRWLHAEEFGRLYGPSDSDMALVTSWLQNHGFQIYKISKGRVTIEFSGSVAQVQEAFHVEMHRYLIQGKEHIANDRDPQIPQALAPVVGGIVSLHDFYNVPQSVFGKYVKRDRSTGKITVLEPTPGMNPKAALEGTNKDMPTLVPSREAAPQLTYTASGSTYPHEDLTPYDFATIYNILPTWNKNILGTGVNIAISGVSDVAVSDFNTFRKSFGLPSTPALITMVNGTDPGEDGGGGQGENTLDVEMAGATAPGAQVILVVSASTSTTGGDELSDSYIIDNEVAPIMSASYGTCELGLGTAGNAAINKIWQQGATEGISIFESSGDQGSAGCSDSDAQGPNADQIGLQVNGIASSPYLTAVGGTDFTWSFVSGGPAKYWNTTNGSQLQTAKGYLPEVPWNGTCANPLVYPIFTNGFTNTEQFCNALIGTDYAGLIKITGGSGGVSHCTAPSGNTSASCSGGYAKPSWQTGSGVPNDSHRDLPDVSLFASDGFPDGIVGSAILFCEASSGSPEKTCDYTNPDYIIYQEIGGTSASSPLMAGIMALVLQKTGTAQGLANPVFYNLYAKQTAAGTSCDSSTDTNASTCIFHDISQGTISQVCITGGPDCVTNTSGDQVGLLSGYAAAKGYDLAVGLGSMNVTNMVNAWPTASGAPAVTLTPTSLTFASTTVGATSSAKAITVKNTGTAALSITNIQITGTYFTSFNGTSTCSSTLAVGATCTISVTFSPTAAGTLVANMVLSDNAGTGSQTAALTGTGAAAASLTVSLSPTSLAFPSTTAGSTSAAQTVTVKNTGTSAVTLTSETLTGTNSTSFVKSATTCGTSLAASATCTVSIEFKPASAGAKTASLSVADNATGSPQTVALSGTGVAAGLTVTLSPTSLTFASTTVGSTSAAQVVTVKNTGTATVTLTSGGITFGGTNASSFLKSATTCATTLAASATCTISVEFKPTVAGSLTAALSVADNATGSPQTVALKGTATAATGGTVTLSPTSIAFPPTIFGTTSDAQVVTLKNGGTASVSVSSIAIGGTNSTSFVQLNTCGATLAGGASCSIYVAFKPSSAAAKTGTLVVTDTGTGSPQSVTLTGTGTSAPTVKLSPTSIAFPTTTHGTTSAAQAVTLTNSGTAALTLTSIKLAGTNPTDFQALDTCGATLAGGASCTVYVAFSPAAAGSFSATLSVADNGSTTTQTVALTGTGK